MQPRLRRELGLRDVTLFAVSSITGIRWIASASHAGPGSIALWVLAALLFLVPLAIAVATLSAKYPGVGGLYLWTREDFGPWHGFLAFWVFWMGIAFWFPGAAMFCITAALYSLPPPWSGAAQDRWVVVALCLFAMWLALGTNLVGLKIGKWTQNAGGIAIAMMWTLLVAAGALAFVQRGSATALHLTPQWDPSTVSFWAGIAYAMSGLEMIGMMGGEIRDPARTLRRAGWIAAAFAAFFYTSSTAAMLILLPADEISEIYGLGQAGQAASVLAGASWPSLLVGGLVLIITVGQFGSLGTAVSRLPLAAGVDHLLPEPFSRIHPRWATPHVAILTLGIVCSVLLIAMQPGDTFAAAYQAIVSLTVLAGFFPYLYVFLSSWRTGHRISAASGIAVTSIAIGCSVVPNERIASLWLFEVKIALGTLAVILSARFVYLRNRNRAVRSTIV